jgi:hypothetical protein
MNLWINFIKFVIKFAVYKIINKFSILLLWSNMKIWLISRFDKNVTLVLRLYESNTVTYLKPTVNLSFLTTFRVHPVQLPWPSRPASVTIPSTFRDHPVHLPWSSRPPSVIIPSTFRYRFSWLPFPFHRPSYRPSYRPFHRPSRELDGTLIFVRTLMKIMDGRFSMGR